MNLPTPCTCRDASSQIFEEQQLTPSRYIRDVRLNAVARALRSTRDARRGILEIALDYGFSDSASFSRAFKAAFGLSPSAWRHRESTMAISVEHLIGPIEPHDTDIPANSMSNGRTANSP